MKILSVLISSAIGLAFIAASPAEAAKPKKSAIVHSTKHSQAGPVAVEAGGLQNGVRRGPLYNGQDYIGDDPDPNIRAYLIRDMTRYRGSF